MLLLQQLQQAGMVLLQQQAGMLLLHQAGMLLVDENSPSVLVRSSQGRFFLPKSDFLDFCVKNR